MNAAVAAADKCFKETWSKVAPAERGLLINKLADLMERDKDEIATLDALDNGKAFTIARDVDVTDSIACFRYFAGWADKVRMSPRSSAEKKRNKVLTLVMIIDSW